MADRLTPRSIALGYLIDIFATADMTLAHRQSLSLILVKQLSEPTSSVIEPALYELREALSSLPPELCDEFDQRLIETTTPDHLWDLMGSLEMLLERNMEVYSSDKNGGPIELDRSSMLGLFVRRAKLAFRKHTFEEICTLVTHFTEWVQESGDRRQSIASSRQSLAPTAGAAAAAGAPPPTPPTPATPLTPLTPGAGGAAGAAGASSAAAAAAAAAAADGGATPGWAYLLPASQLEAHVHSLAKQVEDGSVSTASPEMARELAHLLRLAPHVPQVHYLHLLHHLQSRSYEDALEAFHRYFDLLRGAGLAGAGGGGAREVTRAPTQWASLNLARLELAFNQRGPAVAAVQEAVRSAQQQEDNVCLAYALLWMAHTQAGAVGGPAQGSPARGGGGGGGSGWRRRSRRRRRRVWRRLWRRRRRRR